MENIWYYVQASLCVCVFYSLYMFFFRGMTFFVFNRAYLLMSLLFSFLIPHLHFRPVNIDYHTSAETFLSNPVADTFSSASDRLAVVSETATFSLIPTVYWLVVFVFIARLAYSIFQIFKIKRRALVSHGEFAKFTLADIGQPFVFFNMIFLPKHDVNSLVLEHEKAHVLKHHWIDIMIVEIAGALLWFNPVMMFYRKSIKIQHEYEADAHAASGGYTSEYLECILRHLQVENYGGPIHQFYSKNIKQRINMITRKKTSQKYTLLYALAIPVVALLLAAFSFRSNQVAARDQLLPEGKGGNVVIVVDAGHGGSDLGGKGVGMSEKDFVFTIAKHVQKAGEAHNIKVVLTRMADEYMSLEERVSIAKGHQADVFISLHSNYNRDNISASGIECLVSEKNNRFEDSKQFAEKVIQELATLKGISVAGSKMADYYVLTNNTMPAVILELGYLSNKSDHDFLADEKNQRLISEKIISAVVQYSKR